ncbi:MAG: 30S ribosomal protein S5 [Phycisphaerae bacterium]|nr:30S ribosomal protein S5 [Phycisphaerae bacterium]
MAEFLDDSSTIQSTTVGVYRTSSTVKGGRRFSFGALVVVGDRRGKVGMGYGKANQVPLGIEKAQKEAKRKMRGFPLQGKTIPHMVTAKYGATTVRLLPASPGTGVIAGAPMRAVLEMLGVQDCLTKCYGSSNPKNVVKAALSALEMLRTREKVEELLGHSLPETAVEEAIKRGMAFMPQVKAGEKAQAPVNTVGDERGGGRGGRGGGGGRGGRGGSGGGGRGGRDGGGRRGGGDDAPPAAAVPPTA